MHKKKSAIFFDRDGTLIEDKDYLSDPSKIIFLPGVIEALQKFQAAGFVLVMVSNQSGIGRGYFTEVEYNAVQDKMIAMLEQEGIFFAGYYYCPHAPFENCECRKPNPYMAIKAAEDLNINLSESYMVGDKQSDILFGENFQAKGCFYTIDALGMVI